MHKDNLPWEEYGDYPAAQGRRARRLPMYQWPGGATMVYYRDDSGENVLCGSCATNRPAREILFCGPHEEGPPYMCERCGAALLAAYGDPYILDGVDLSFLPREWQDMDEDLRQVAASDDQDAWAFVEELQSLRWKLGRLQDPGRIVHHRTKRIKAAESRMRNILTSWIGTKHPRAYCRGQEILAEALAAAEDLS